MFSSFTVTIDDKSSTGWQSLSSGNQPNDRDVSEIQKLYRDALEATRKNPLAKAILDITTDFVLGDGIQISSPHGRMSKFIDAFWNHPQNLIDTRLQPLCDELTRAGDLFVVLFRNPTDGMSYIRFITKEQIVSIETAENDWETEIIYNQATDNPMEPIKWLSPRHPEAGSADAVMLHYSINRPIGATFGEGDIDTVVPWLLRYSRMLEDRVRLHWSLRNFLWFVQVPSNQVDVKSEQYKKPPEAGSVIVHDNAEAWDVKAPAVHGADASHDMKAVRQMVDAVGFPPHWRGESGDANLATAQAMQLRPERHLRRRQNYIVYIIEDIIYNAFARAAQVGAYGGSLPRVPFHKLFNAVVSDISRNDNDQLANAARNMADAMNSLFTQFPIKNSPTLAKLALRMIFKFAGEPQDDDVLNSILTESGHNPAEIADLDVYKSNGQIKVKFYE